MNNAIDLYMLSNQLNTAINNAIDDIHAIKSAEHSGDLVGGVGNKVEYGAAHRRLARHHTTGKFN
jgi:hypothetical protein